MYKLDLDLEKAKKEEDLAKELEKVGNEAQVAETRTSILNYGPIVPNQNISQYALASSSTISAQIPMVQKYQC